MPDTIEISEQVARDLGGVHGLVKMAEEKLTELWMREASNAGFIEANREEAAPLLDKVHVIREHLIAASSALSELRFPGYKFPLGRLVVTAGAQMLFGDMDALAPYIKQHASGEWGDLDDEDKATNEAAVRNGTRILSKYSYTRRAEEGGVPLLGRAEPFYIITEHDRSVTTVLLVDEY